MHLVLDTTMFALFLWLGLRRRTSENTAPWPRAFAVPVVAFVLGFAMHFAVFTAPFRSSKRPDVSNYVYHTFAHPLVLGLGVPENDLSRREEIVWNDQLGLKLAQRAVPQATYLGPLYEGALLRYYFGLWRQSPGAMLGAYFVKLRADGSGVFESVAGLGTTYHIPPAIGEFLHRTTNGIVLIVVALAAFIVALRQQWTNGGARPLVIGLTSLAALASLGEGLLTYSTFVGIYSSILLFFVFFVALLVLQAVVDAIARRVSSAALAR